MVTNLASRARKGGLLVALFGASGFFAWWVNRFYAIDAWLFWRYALCWAVVVPWGFCCLSVGHAILGRFFRGSLPMVERLTLDLAVGLLAFGLAMFFLGLAHALGWVTFFALPIAFIAVGGSGLVKDLARLRKRLRLGVRASIDLRTVPLVLLGALGIGILYFEQLSPTCFSFDARWYHIPMAQRYALTGAIGPFKEGFWPASFPHMATYVYTWTFLMPGVSLFDRLEMCSHIEFLLFLSTLAQIPVLVRHLVGRAPGAGVGLSWLARLAFPGIYLYDGNLHAGADHIAGFWAIPIALTLWRAWRKLTTANTLLFVACIGGAVLTKYTTLPLVAAAGLALFGRALWLCARRRALPELRALGALVAGSLVITAPQWLKNWIWYGDPAYPVLRSYLKVHPWNPDVPAQLAFLEATGRPGALSWQGLLDAARATVNFSFIPNNWEYFHHDVPVFGSLFTLTLPALFFVRGGRRVAPLYALTMTAIFGWYLLTHYDRYLQAIGTLMAAATAATVILIWQSGLLARLAASLMIGLQVVWGGDVPFFRTHNQINDSPIRYVAAFLASGFEKASRNLFEPLTSIGKLTPPSATVLAHDVIVILGIDRNWVTDLHQSLFSYARLGSPAAIHAQLKDLGVTHLVWADRSINRDSVAGDLAFLNYAVRYTQDQKRAGWLTVGTLPAAAPQETATDYKVAYFGCGRPYRAGWYQMSQLTRPVLHPTSPLPQPERELTSPAEATERADLVVFDTNCGYKWAPTGEFVLGTTRDEGQLYVRVRPRTRP